MFLSSWSSDKMFYVLQLHLAKTKQLTLLHLGGAADSMMQRFCGQDLSKQKDD